MDIIDRLNIFMEKNGITKSQFADNCGIPRPTVSQILSGRNKKISDDIISKIHLVYPDLSILWLMFGEGTMCDDGVSENSVMDLVDNPNSSVAKSVKPSENSLFDDHLTSNWENQGMNGLKSSIVESNFSTISTLSKNSDYKVVDRKITKIVVFYSDNSFEEFFK